MIGEAARQAGARIIATGDTAQLGAVEAGGMFRLLAQEVPAARAARGPPVRRAVGAGGQRPAPRRRPGRGRRLRPARPDPRRRRRKPPTTAPPRCGSPTTCAARTCCCSPGPTPKPPSYPAASRPSSPRWAASAPPQAPLSDGNHAGVGDLVRARLNTEIDAGGRQLTNRDTLTGHRVPRAPTPRCGGSGLDGTWTGPFRVPRSYLAGQRRTRLRRQRPRRPGPHRRHRPPPGHRLPVPAGPVRRHDPRPRIQHRARGHRQDRPARARALPAGRPRIRARRRPAARRRRPVRHRADPPGPGMGRRNRPPAQPVVRRRPADPAPARSTSRSRPGSPNPRPGGTSASTPGRPSSTSYAPPSSPDTTSAP